MSNPEERLKSEICAIILSALREVQEQMGKGTHFPVAPETRLYGRGSDLDSLGLVHLIVDVEEKVAERYGLAVTLTDEKALSQEHSPFRTADSLATFVARLLVKEGAVSHAGS